MPNLKGVVLLLIIAIFALGVSARADVPESPNDDLRLWYDEAATIWEEYLPLGNGRLGMMPSGGVATDHIILNEGTMWAGQVQHTDNDEAYLDRDAELRDEFRATINRLVPNRIASDGRLMERGRVPRP